MTPRILEGDIIIVRIQPDAETGDIVVVQIENEHATCKKLMKYREGISLISFNPAYDPMTFTKEEVISKPVSL